MFGQVRILAVPITVDHDNDHRSAHTCVMRWMHGDHHTGDGAQSIWIIYLLPDAGSGCRTKMVLVETRPLVAADFPLQIGDLVLFEASLHRWDDRSGTTPRFKSDHVLVTRTSRRRLYLMLHATVVATPPAGQAGKGERQRHKHCSIEVYGGHGIGEVTGLPGGPYELIEGCGAFDPRPKGENIILITPSGRPAHFATNSLSIHDFWESFCSSNSAQPSKPERFLQMGGPFLQGSQQEW
ncbi:hypothetical protein B0H17DRAFT_1142879 [Mycena rosella]|uniref:Uncharacterized protein n=1 Tax=Mycena rosella TaxID=1033263 RepID=A0AAD7CWD2_MYCRO|nr:hypothetical protein B0H17DRAFT_1142879 [Mycena rosella]